MIYTITWFSLKENTKQTRLSTQVLRSLTKVRLQDDTAIVRQASFVTLYFSYDHGKSQNGK